MVGHGTFHWNELMTDDVERAKNFFSATLGWTFNEMPMDEGFTYWVAMSGDTVVGGLMSTEDFQHDIPSHWLGYIEVDDIDMRLAKVVEAGGSIIREAFDIAGVGRIAILKDPTGAVIGWIMPAQAKEA